MKISIIVPVYNVERYLERCLDSILVAMRRFMAVAAENSVELICVNDGSPDGSQQILDRYGEKVLQSDSATPPRITWKVIVKENGGLGSARNAGLDAMTGDYVLFVDSDDWIVPSTLVKFATVAQATDVEVVASAEFFKDEVPEDAEQEQAHWSIHPASWIAGKRKMQYCAWNKLYRADVFKNRRFLSGYYEDFPFTTALFCDIEKFAVLEERLYVYCTNAGAESIIRSPMSDRKEQDSFKVIRYVLDHAKGKPSIGFAIRQCADGTAMTINKLWRKRNLELTVKFLEDWNKLTAEYPDLPGALPIKSKIRLWLLKKIVSR